MLAWGRSRSAYIFDGGARLLVIAFALLLAIPAGGLFFADDRERSRWENRPLAQLPAPLGPARGDDLFAGLDLYLADHFGFALQLNSLHRRLLFYVFRDSPSQALTVGRDGFVFVTSGGMVPAPFSNLESLCIQGQDPNVAKRAIRTWTQFLDHYRAMGIRAALAIIPPKPVIYPEMLPISVPRRYRQACSRYSSATSVAGALLSWARSSDHLVIYPFEEFRARRYEGNFYPRENFHYQGESAHTAGREILKRLGISVNPEYERGTTGTTVTTDIWNLVGFERSITTKLYDYAHFAPRDMIGAPDYILRYYAKARVFGTIETRKPMSERKALVIGNSFTRPTAVHLAPGYRSLVWIQMNDLEESEGERFFNELIARVAPDDLIFVHHDTAIVSRAGGGNWPARFLNAARTE